MLQAVTRCNCREQNSGDTAATVERPEARENPGKLRPSVRLATETSRTAESHGSGREARLRLDGIGY